MNHNSFFKVTFQSRENVIDFLKHRLPSELLKDISLDTLEIAKDSFIDPNYRDIQSDMLFKVSIAGKESYIYLLLEHKSYPDRMTAFQLLKYIVGIWTLHLNQLEKGEAEKQRATHKARLKTAISMRKKGLDLLQIPNPRLIQPRYNFQLAI